MISRELPVSAYVELPRWGYEVIRCVPRLDFMWVLGIGFGVLAWMQALCRLRTIPQPLGF